jgi:hypothetical protein
MPAPSTPNCARSWATASTAATTASWPAPGTSTRSAPRCPTLTNAMAWAGTRCCSCGPGAKPTSCSAPKAVPSAASAGHAGAATWPWPWAMPGARRGDTALAQALRAARDGLRAGARTHRLGLAQRSRSRPQARAKPSISHKRQRHHADQRGHRHQPGRVGAVPAHAHGQHVGAGRRGQRRKGHHHRLLGRRQPATSTSATAHRGQDEGGGWPSARRPGPAPSRRAPNCRPAPTAIRPSGKAAAPMRPAWCWPDRAGAGQQVAHQARNGGEDQRVARQFAQIALPAVARQRPHGGHVAQRHAHRHEQRHPGHAGRAGQALGQGQRHVGIEAEGRLRAAGMQPRSTPGSRRSA